MSINPYTDAHLDPGHVIKGAFDQANNATRVNILNNSVPANWDFASLTPASTTDTWIFKSGGSGGTTLRTILITYTDNTKATISTVALS